MPAKFHRALKKTIIFSICIILSLSATGNLLAQDTASRPSARAAAGKPSPPVPARQQDGRGEMVGISWVGQAGVEETTAEIMERERLSARPPQDEEAEVKKVRPNRKNLPQNPNSPDAPQWPPRNENEVSEAPLDPQTLGLSFTGATLSETGAFPPDSMGAVGPTQFLVGVNGRIKVFDKNTGAVGSLNASMNTFFSSVRNGFGTSDPRVRYDRLSGRWFVLIINVSTPNRVLIAVSDTATISLSTVWTFYFFQQDTVAPAGDAGCLADYPTLGIDASALYIGVNQFCGPLLNFGGTTAFVVRKSSVLSGGPIVVSAFRNLTGTTTGPGPYTPQGVDNYDPAATEGYFIGVDNATFGTLMVRRVTDPGGTPVMSANIPITVSSTTFPITVRHQGNTGGSQGNLDGLDDRLFAAHIRNGSLWTAHNISVNNTGTTTGTRTRNASRWYEITGLNTATPSVVQSGTLFAATAANDFDQRNYWIPSVMVSGQGHMAMGSSAAGTSEFANAATAGRLAGDPLGALQSPVLYTASATAYNPPGDSGASNGARRWGDYSYTSLDPCDDMTMWTIQEFCDATNSYGVRVVKLIAPPPATPVSANPPTIAAGQSSVNVTITGAQVSGSGFFDPGAGFSCRIGAGVSGNITVNSVTYNSPTSVTLNLSTVGATDGAQNVTITNPDGQSRTGNGLITISGGCSYSINPTSQNFNPGGGSSSLNVTAPSGCGWTATSNDSFITISSGSMGSGNGVVNYSVSPNTTASPRTGTMTIAGLTFTVNQTPCSYSINPASETFAFSGGTSSVNVTATSGCPWTAVSNASFITITSGAAGTGNGAVNYTVSANPTTTPRTGTMTIAGQTFTVTQSGAPVCSFAISPSSNVVEATGGSGSVSVTTQAGCGWSAVSNASFITITSGAAGTGNGTVNYTVGVNTTSSIRTGTMTIAGQTLTITQAGASCVSSITPSSRSLTSGSQSSTVSVSAASSCNWTAQSQAGWITITSGGAGPGPKTLKYAVAANPSTSPRSGAIIIGSKVHTVIQAGIPCSYSISPSGQNFTTSGGGGTVNVTATAGCGWTAVSNVGWAVITSGGSGSGSGVVNYTVGANSGGTRSGTLTIAGQSFTLIQEGVSGGCSYTIAPTSQSYTSSGGSGNVTVTTQAGCQWTAVSNESWVTITTGSSGSGSGAVSYTVAVNPDPGSRSGTMTIAGQTFTVTEGGNCTYAINPGNRTMGKSGGSASVSVTAPGGCGWTAVSNAGWITVTTGSSGSGNGTVNYTVSVNTTGTTRTGTVTIAGKTHTVKQSAF
jgi:hypothetical protein